VTGGRRRASWASCSLKPWAGGAQPPRVNRAGGAPHTPGTADEGFPDAYGAEHMHAIHALTKSLVVGNGSAHFAPAAVVVLVLDARAGVTPEDEHVARWLKRCRAEMRPAAGAAFPPVFVVANKCESMMLRAGADDPSSGDDDSQPTPWDAFVDEVRTGDRWGGWPAAPWLIPPSCRRLQHARQVYKLGFGPPIAISAETGDGWGDLHDAIAEHVPLPPVARDGVESGRAGSSAGDADVADGRAVKFGLVGRPNVGKSSLINKLLG